MRGVSVDQARQHPDLADKVLDSLGQVGLEAVVVIFDRVSQQIVVGCHVIEVYVDGGTIVGAHISDLQRCEAVLLVERRTCAS